MPPLSVTPLEPLAPIHGLINFIYVLLGGGLILVVVLFVLSRRPGTTGRVARALLEVLLDMAAGRRGRRTARPSRRVSREALEMAYEKSPSVSSEGYAFRVAPKSYFFSKAEGAFFPALLEAAAQQQLLVFPKVGLCDVFVDTKDAESGQRLRYAQMHVDYLLVRSGDFRPVAGIELNGASHQADKQQANDRKKKAVFDAAGVPLLTFYNQPSYAVWEIQTRLQDVMGLPAKPGRR